MGTATHRPARLRRAGPAALLLLVATLVVLRLAVAEPFRISSESMLPTLHSGDQVLVDKRAYRHTGSERRGDLAVLRAPRSGQILLKRIVAVAGDTVAIKDGLLYVDGRLRNEPYVDQRAIDGLYFGPVRVPVRTVFVLGDNRANSEDSRAFGAVATGRLIGRVLARVWPPGRLGVPR
ncbi:MAG: signal peptidase [Solirubrobacteraceae bacterium]|nr:signal peptidase [Solirubrobacteraceae bacterium]